MLRLLPLLTVALLGAMPARAEIVVVPLSLPEYPLFLYAGETVQLPFDAERALANVSQVGVRLKGDETFFRNICWTFGDYGGGQWWRRDVLGLTAGLHDGQSVLGETTMAYAPADYPQDLGISLDLVLVLDHAGWTCLADGAGTLQLTGLECDYFAVYPEVCACDPSMTLTLVELIVATDGSVPLEAATWSAAKARYR